MYIEKEKENTAMRSDQEQQTNRTRKKQKNYMKQAKERKMKNTYKFKITDSERNQ